MTDYASVISRGVADHQAVIATIPAEYGSQILQVASRLSACLEQGGCVFWFGNGGSAADSQHLAAELVGRFVSDRRALRSVALTTDTSILTSVGNDFGYEHVFSRQIEALGRPGDVAIGISTSGNSDNVAHALAAAKAQGMETVALLGRDGGRIGTMADHALIISSDVTARIQEAHIFIGHMLCELIERNLGLVDD